MFIVWRPSAALLTAVTPIVRRSPYTLLTAVEQQTFHHNPSTFTSWRADNNAHRKHKFSYKHNYFCIFLHGKNIPTTFAASKLHIIVYRIKAFSRQKRGIVKSSFSYHKGVEKTLQKQHLFLANLSQNYLVNPNNLLLSLSLSQARPINII